MRRKNIYISSLFCLAILILCCCNDVGNTKGTPSPGYSETTASSKENGVFQFELVPTKPMYQLSKGYSFGIQQAWVENTRSRKHYIFGTPPIDKSDSAYQVILKLTIKKDSLGKNGNYFYFIGNKPLDTFMHYYYEYKNIADSIKVPLYRSFFMKLHKKEKTKAIDSIIFVKRMII